MKEFTVVRALMHMPTDYYRSFLADQWPLSAMKGLINQGTD